MSWSYSYQVGLDWLVNISAVIFLNTIIFLYSIHKKHIGVNNLKEDQWVQFRVENNVNFLIFWATIFLSCFIGIIELIPEIAIPVNPFQFVVYVLYCLLMVGMNLSMRGFLRIYRENVYFWSKGYFGDWYKKCPVITSSDLDSFLLDDNGEVKKNVDYVAFIPIIIFIWLYITKIIALCNS